MPQPHPGRLLANSAEIFGRHDLEEECYWQLVGGNRDAVKYPIMHRTAPATENDQVPDVNSPKAEKPWDIQQSASQKPEKEGKDSSTQSWAQRVRPSRAASRGPWAESSLHVEALLSLTPGPMGEGGCRGRSRFLESLPL